MPFEEDDIDLKKNSLPSSKKNLNQVSSKKSMFDKEKIPDYSERANKINDNLNSYKSRLAHCASQLKKILDDKTLVSNKSPISKSLEKEIVLEFINLAMEINNDEYEQEGAGSLGCITFTFNLLIQMRDKLNQYEYDNAVLVNKINKLTDKVEKLSKA